MYRRFPPNMMTRILLLQWVRRLWRLKEEWSYSQWWFWMFWGSEHNNSQHFLAWMSPYMATFAKLTMDLQTSVFVHNMTWKEIEFCQNYSPRFPFQIKNWQRKKLKHIKAKNICPEKKKIPHISPGFCPCRLRWLTAVSQIRSNSRCMNR